MHDPIIETSYQQQLIRLLRELFETWRIPYGRLTLDASKSQLARAMFRGGAIIDFPEGDRLSCAMVQASSYDDADTEYMAITPSGALVAGLLPHTRVDTVIEACRSGSSSILSLYVVPYIDPEVPLSPLRLECVQPKERHGPAAEALMDALMRSGALTGDDIAAAGLRRADVTVLLRHHVVMPIEDVERAARTDEMLSRLDPHVLEFLRAHGWLAPDLYNCLRVTAHGQYRRLQAAIALPNLAAFLPQIAEGVDRGEPPITGLRRHYPGVELWVWRAYGAATLEPSARLRSGMPTGPLIDALGMLSRCDGTWAPTSPAEWSHLLKAGPVVSWMLGRSGKEPMREMAPLVTSPGRRWRDIHAAVGRAAPTGIEAVRTWFREAVWIPVIAPYLRENHPTVPTEGQRVERDALRHILRQVPLPALLRVMARYADPRQRVVFRRRMHAIRGGFEEWLGMTPPLRCLAMGRVMHVIPVTNIKVVTLLAELHMNCLADVGRSAAVGLSHLVMVMADEVALKALGEAWRVPPRQRARLVPQLVANLSRSSASQVLVADIAVTTGPRLVFKSARVAQAESLFRRPPSGPEAVALDWYIRVLNCHPAPRRQWRRIVAEVLFRPDRPKGQSPPLLRPDTPDERHAAFRAAEPFLPAKGQRVRGPHRWAQVFDLDGFISRNA